MSEQVDPELSDEEFLENQWVRAEQSAATHADKRRQAEKDLEWLTKQFNRVGQSLQEGDRNTHLHSVYADLLERINEKKEEVERCEEEIEDSERIMDETEEKLAELNPEHSIVVNNGGDK